MKQKIYYLFFLLPVLQGCVANNQTGQMEPGWLFWVFLGILLGGVFLGALISFLRKRKPDDTPTKAEEEIEAYEKTLKNKLEDNSEDQEKK